LIADDSALIRKILVDILKTEEFIGSISIARNGKECVDKALTLQPDIITLDIEMPIMDGLSALEELIRIKSSPIIIMLSSFTTKGAETTIKALELGAADFITKPKGMFFQENINTLKTELITKIKDLTESKYIYEPASKIVFPRYNKIKKESLPVFENIKYLIGIGTSTGGPRALQDVITQLPENLPGAVFIVQHMPPVFTKSLADRLNSISSVRVKEAENGEKVKAGYVYIAPGNYHMEIIHGDKEGYKIITNQKPLVNGHRPSVDVMMDSLARLKTERIIAVIMTGMGSDGADGIKKVKNVGGMTIAQNEETCVVYGMPKAAAATNAIDVILPLEDITKTILRYMGV
jgi:two-component system chemotaxis response regulator CheB